MTDHFVPLLGIDTGGTFTDFVLYDGTSLRTHKCLSTPAAPERAILQGIAALGLDPRALRLVHGSTVATNAVLEGKGVRTVFITNRGFKDMLSIGRQARRDLYDLQPRPLPPPVPPELCLEVDGRLAADGSELEPLDEHALTALRETLRRLAPRAVAINLLFSFLDPRHEQAVAAAVPADMFVSRSSAVLPEYREYERGIATWLNAWVGPIVQGYLQRLQAQLGGARIAVMQSSGDTMALDTAGRHAVRLLLSGPAGGLAAAAFIGRGGGRPRLLSFDMGGTSTDVALIDGDITLTSEGAVGPYPVAVPMVDIHTLGAGGGSIAYIDGGGLLRVGPISAGAEPGPACYGRGGSEATVTDANLLLGRLPAGARLGGSVALDGAAARAALARIATRLQLSPEEAALGIVQIANEHMVQALRVISVQRGIDPRDYTLFSFGGAGGLHVCALAEALDMRHAMVPAHAGVLSALGMLAAPRGRQLSRTVGKSLDEIAEHDIAAGFDALAAQGRAELLEEGVHAAQLHHQRTVDLRYRGQSSALNLPWRDKSTAAAAFHAAHAARYGHRLALPVELVNLRLSLRGPAPALNLDAAGAVADDTHDTTPLHGVTAAAPLWRREQLAPDRDYPGPALILDASSTTYLAPGWRARRDEAGNLLLTRDTH